MLTDFNPACSSDFASFTLTIRCAFAKTSREEEIKRQLVSQNYAMWCHFTRNGYCIVRF